MAEPEKKIASTKYTALELKDRGIGKFIDRAQAVDWSMKLSTYKDEGIKEPFHALNRSLIILCTDFKGHRYVDMAHRVAQIIMDRYLFRRCSGQDVPVPGPLVEAGTQVNSSVAKTGKVVATALRSDFTKWDGKIDTISDINWLYNNLMVKDVKPEDAPSPGAWAHLQYHRSSKAAMAEFFTKVYPRLIPAKSTMQKMQDKFHDDGRTTFDLLDRLLAEDAAGEGEVPVLQVVLPERAGLQDQAGQSALSQTDS